MAGCPENCTRKQTGLPSAHKRDDRRVVVDVAGEILAQKHAILLTHEVGRAVGPASLAVVGDPAFVADVPCDAHGNGFDSGPASRIQKAVEKGMALRGEFRLRHPGVGLGDAILWARSLAATSVWLCDENTKTCSAKVQLACHAVPEEIAQAVLFDHEVRGDQAHAAWSSRISVTVVLSGLKTSPTLAWRRLSPSLPAFGVTQNVSAAAFNIDCASGVAAFDGDPDEDRRDT